MAKIPMALTMKQKVGVKCKCKCGSTTHSHPTHGDCPLNKKRRADVPDSLHDNVTPTESSESDGDIVCLSSDSSVDESGDAWQHNDLISGSLCMCGALNCAHKTYCPMNSRNRSSHVLFGADNAASALSDYPCTTGSERSDCTTESKKFRTSNKDGDGDGF